MGRIQHDEDNYSADSPSPPPKKGRRRKGAKAAHSSESASPPPKKATKRKRDPSNKKRGRSEASASPPIKKKDKRIAESSKADVEPRSEQVPAQAAAPHPASNFGFQSGFGATMPQPGMAAMAGMGGMGGMPNMTGMPPMAGMPNIAALSSSVGADLGQARLAHGLNTTGFTAGGDPSPIVKTQAMDFSKPKKDMMHVSMDVQQSLVPTLMTTEHRKLLAEESGAEIEWDPSHFKVRFSGSAEQLQRASRLLSRVRTQCCWGQGEGKIRRLLKPKKLKTVRCRLSPMDTLVACEKTLSLEHPLLKIGKGPENHLILANPYRVVSRVHCILELDENRGGVYIHDCSTNGTFLNGRRLPAQQEGKILVSHGDELLFKDPADGRHEFGYIVNLQEIVVEADIKLEAPRRMLTADERGPVVSEHGW